MGKTRSDSTDEGGEERNFGAYAVIELSGTPGPESRNFPSFFGPDPGPESRVTSPENRDFFALGKTDLIIKT